MNHDENNKQLSKAIAWLMKERQCQELETQIEAAMNRLKEFALPALPSRSKRMKCLDKQAVEWLIYSVQKETL